MARTDQELPNTDQVLDELDHLARISSVEAYYQAELDNLHALALAVVHRPNDRSGRYAALREALEMAFDRIADESYRDAAVALLGYADRWRSVESRGTDAGRAFTPSVSYDAFRRRSGRNYRENTLRATADALWSLLDDPDPAPPLPEPPLRDPVPASDGPPTSPVGRQVALLVGAMALVALVVAVTSLLRDRGAANDAPTPVALPVFVVTPTPQVEAVEPEPPAEVMQEIDVTRQCRRQGLDPDTTIAERDPNIEGGWVCRSEAGSWSEVPDIGAACRDQYGPSAVARMADGWTCDISPDLVHRPANPPAPATCAYPVGAYDSKAVAFERYSTRFVQAYVSAELPSDVCAMGPLHYYDELERGGVTQLLARNGQPYGAILADDPANVVVLTGPLWTAFEAVRGIQLYRLGIAILEDRVGYPASQLRRQGEIHRLDLTSGGALIAMDPSGSFVWMPSISLALWERYGGADGCLGVPTRPPRTEPGSPAAQEFEHATVSLDPTTGAITFEPADVCVEP